MSKKLFVIALLATMSWSFQAMAEYPTDCLGEGEPSAAVCGDVSFEGCCDDAGRVVWCQDGALYCLDCAGQDATCGWSVDSSYYLCGAEGADPTGTNPLTCVTCEPACGDGEFCNAGTCEACSCGDANCGVDQCGNSCGTCEGDTYCDAGTCVQAQVCENPQVVNCDDVITGTTSGASLFDSYTCNTWDETGPEAFFMFTAAVDDVVTVTFESDVDLDLFVLAPLCSDQTCVGAADNGGELEVIAGATYYAVLDGYQGAAGAYTLTVACQSTCVPQCEGKVCGDNGCGGVCGECEAGNVCMAGACVVSACEEGDIEDCGGNCGPISWVGDGYCDDGAYGADFNCEGFNFDEGDCEPCYPTCDGIECGDDGCGGSCGECEAGFLCEEGLCAVCEAQCDGKVCGDDGCGGTCGECDAGNVCMAGACVVSNCEAGEIEDCDGVCGPIDWLGDSYCDDGAYGSNFNCEAFNFDEGDCDNDPNACPMGGTAVADSCNGVTWEGCCDGGTVQYCGTGAEQCPAGMDSCLCTLDCEAAGYLCTWITAESYAWCAEEADPNEPEDLMCMACEPSCVDAECGDDGCGGSCGTCDEGWMCVEGTCEEGVCVPDCEGLECGDDGCEGSCGTCNDGFSCEEGLCVEDVCVPDCDGFDCGDDGCGGSCGTCNEGFSCEEGLCVEDVCVPDCEGFECGDDGCGGSCGECAEGSCVEGICVVECVPMCDGKTCGDDGCNGTCGTCGLNQECSVDGICEDTTTPDTDTIETPEDVVDTDTTGGGSSGGGGCSTTGSSMPAAGALLALMGLALVGLRRRFSL